MTSENQDRPDYARSAGPVASTAIRTDLRGVVAADTRIDSAGFALPAYAAWPEGGPNRPVVLVICEAFGLHEHIKDIVRRFAKAGHFAVAPDLMTRQGHPMAFDDTSSLVRDLLVKIPDAQVMDDLDACVTWAGRQGGDVQRLAATGFCWGGRWTWLYAAYRKLDAAVAWYGIVDGRSTGMFPDDPGLFPLHPVDITDDLQAPVLGLYGGRDEAIPLDTVERMRGLLAQGSAEARRSDIHAYPHAGHAFFADYRDTYDPEAAADGWRRCVAWIERSSSGQSDR